MFLAVIGTYCEVVPLVNSIKKFGDFLRGVLQIVIHSDYDIPLSGAEATEYGIVLTAVSQQPHNLKMRATVLQPLENFLGVVRTAVIDNDDFEILPPRGQNRFKSRHKGWQ